MGLKNRDDSSPNGLHNTLSAATTVKGDIVTEGDFRLDGQIEGNINCGGRLVVGPKALIKGNITSLKAEILGRVIGNIRAGETLVLKATAIVEGDVFTRTLEIEPQARFSGVCNMSGHPEKGN